MRRALSAFLSLALAASAAPPAAYAQAAVRLTAPKAVVPVAPIPAGALGLRTPGGLSLTASFIGTPAPTPGLLPAANAAPAAKASAPVRAEAPVLAVPTARAAAAAAPAAPEARPAAEALTVPAGLEPANDNAPEAQEDSAAVRETKGRVALRFAELRAAFGSKASEELPPSASAEAAQDRPGAALAPASSQEGGRPAVQPPAPQRKAKGRGLFGIAPVLVFFLAALAVESVGIEAQNLGLPPLIAKVFGDVTLSAEMGMWASLADIVGSVVTPAVIKKIGLKETFLWSGGARLVLGGVLAGFLAAGHMTVPWLMGLTALGALVGGINYTAEKAIPAVILDQDRAGLERFKAARQGVIEVVATLIPIAAGALVSTFGFLPAVFAFPVAGAVAMAMVAMTLRLPKRAMRAVAVRLPDERPAGMKDFWRSVTRGTKLLWTDPGLRTPFLGYAAFGIISHLLYWIIAPAYGILVAGPGMEEHAALVQGVMLGLFSLGGLAASVFLMREHKRFDKLGPGEREGAMRRSLKRWMVLGTVALAAMATMAFPLPAWGALTVPALALLPFGMAQVVAKLKLEALFQSAAPPEALDDATAALEAWMSVAIMAGLWGVKAAFAAAAGYGAFALIAWAALPLAAACLVLTSLLARTKKTV